jgi:hypothetical protein
MCLSGQEPVQRGTPLHPVGAAAAAVLEAQQVHLVEGAECGSGCLVA